MAEGDAAVWSAISVKTVQRAQMTGASRILVLNKDGVVRAGSESATIGTRIETRANPECPACDSARAEESGATSDVMLAHILRGKGVLYDSLAVDACVKLFREKGFSL